MEFQCHYWIWKPWVWLSATVSCSNRCQTRILAPSCGSEMELQWHERRDKRVEIGGPHKCRDVPYMCRNYGYLNNQALSPHYLYLAAESGLEACKSRAPPCELGHNLLCAALLVHQQGALQVSPLGGSAVIFVRSPFTPMLSPPSSSFSLCQLPLFSSWNFVAFSWNLKTFHYNQTKVRRLL